MSEIKLFKLIHTNEIVKLEELRVSEKFDGLYSTIKNTKL